MKQAPDAEEMLMFPRDFLLLLKETQLFGPLVDKAIEDIETFIKMNQAEKNDISHRADSFRKMMAKCFP